MWPLQEQSTPTAPTQSSANVTPAAYITTLDPRIRGRFRAPVKAPGLPPESESSNTLRIANVRLRLHFAVVFISTSTTSASELHKGKGKRVESEKPPLRALSTAKNG